MGWENYMYLLLIFLLVLLLRTKNMNKMLGTFYHQVYIGKVMMLRK